MCDECCKEFKGWCKAFTGAERALTILEALLLVILVVFLIFLILHLLACSNPQLPSRDEADNNFKIQQTTSDDKVNYKTTSSKPAPSGQTMDPERECSWTPSAKTTAITHYYENGATKETRHTTSKSVDIIDTASRKLPVAEDFSITDQSDGEDADDTQKRFVLALVKLKPPQDVVFGCILTLVSAYWLITAASCIEAIEEVDSLDSFVIMEDYGASASADGRIRTVFDTRIHPLYGGTNRSYDLAALKSDSSLGAGRAAALPSALEPALLAPGERLHVLGFGGYRSVEAGRRLRAARTWRVAGALCPGAAAGALRHLAGGRALPPAPCAAAGPLCCAPLAARALPCTYCAGAPLLRRGALLGVMADNQLCGVACEPQLYVNVAALRDWIDSVLD